VGISSRDPAKVFGALFAFLIVTPWVTRLPNFLYKSHTFSYQYKNECEHDHHSAKR
jgi:hypothetical protein